MGLRDRLKPTVNGFSDHPPEDDGLPIELLEPKPTAREPLPPFSPRILPPPKPKPKELTALSAPEAEKAVLSSIMQAGSKAMRHAESVIGESSFHIPAHKEVWKVIQSLHFDNEPIDLISITQRTMDFGLLDQIGGIGTLNDLLFAAPTAANMDYYMALLKEKSLKRELRQLGTTLTTQAEDQTQPPQEILKAAKARIDSIYQRSDRQADELTFSELLEADTKNDENNVLGYRWLCRGGSCLFVGQSGIGKSSIAAQASIRWGQGLDLFGVTPWKGRKLKSLFIQAENDSGDLSEMVQGVVKGYPLPEGMTLQDFGHMLNEKLVFVRDAINTGPDFARNAARLIDKHKPDLVWVDPLLSYCGDDISSQKVASNFLRNTLNPIALDSGIVWMLLHHTGKPSQDPKSKQHWSDHDFSYAAFGSSELVNWARAVNVLRSIGDGKFELRFTKRGKRAGLKSYMHDQHEGSQYTDVVYLKYGTEGIYWEQIDEPTEEELTNLKKPRAKNSGTFEQKFTPEQIIDLMRTHNRSFRAKELCNLAMDEMGISKASFYRLWDAVKKSPEIHLNAQSRYAVLTNHTNQSK
jgi:hypothetical protein